MRGGESRRPRAEGREKAEGRVAKNERNAGSGGVLLLFSERWLRLSCRIICCLVFLCVAGAMVAGEPNGASELPASSLNPPRGEIPPSIWEQYGGWIIAGSVLAVAVLAAGIWFLTRPKPEERAGERRRPRAEGRKKVEIRVTKNERNAGSGGVLLLFSERWLRLSCRIICCLVFLCVAGATVAGEPNGASELPASSLNPPRGEIPPSIWEQYGGWIIAGSVLAVAVLAAGIWFLTRPKPEEKEPSVVTARRELETLAAKEEDATVLVRTSQILHRYIAASFSMPADQMTTREFCDGMFKTSELGVELARETSEFLQRCDVKKFAPAPPTGSLRAVATALAIIDRAEQRLAHLHQSAVAAGAASTPQASKQVPGASGA